MKKLLRRVRAAARNDLKRTTGLRFGLLYLWHSPRVLLGWFLLSLVTWGVLLLIQRATGWQSFPAGLGMAVLLAGGLYVSPRIYSARHEDDGEV
ncbi:hypothetical protein CC117_27540 [Parafrankia colletiae]|uniref:Uncharacterized protein n=1 Tax=Parafrankia colletiae TaxID=573497 RepID=A0A1S1Q9U0_9ACTN|nr:hypothetical protein [Parafrankia colletiae]MCK9903129.1 hypothetical protein [Frankia sp. Cpl3]OHV30377.1 hypothetical protein CC117_27540 [Parafrankia colletiae]